MASVTPPNSRLGTLPYGVGSTANPNNFTDWFQKICCWTSAWNYNVNSAYDDAGNFNFGATGIAVGLPESTLMWGGGLKKNLDYWSKGQKNPYRSQPYMNDPHKMAMIQLGILYAQSTCGSDN